jgi:cytosine/adenosine deaminase-related metal-dependent hydrolase
MRSTDFITESTVPDDIGALALKYLTKMLASGITSASAINNVIDVLLLKGVNHTLAATAAKQAYATISGKDFLA